MAATHTITELVQTDGRLITKSTVHSSGGVAAINGEEVADSETDYEIAIAIDVSAVKSLYLVSDQDVTFETNDGSAPDNSISLKAGVPYVWHEDSYHVFLLTVDVTSIFITNASGAVATIDLEVVQDATP